MNHNLWCFRSAIPSECNSNRWIYGLSNKFLADKTIQEFEWNEAGSYDKNKTFILGAITCKATRAFVCSWYCCCFMLVVHFLSVLIRLKFHFFVMFVDLVFSVFSSCFACAQIQWDLFCLFSCIQFNFYHFYIDFYFKCTELCMWPRLTFCHCNELI